LFLWQWSEPEIWLDDTELRKQGLGLIVLNARVDNNIITWDPVDWGRDAVLVAGLKGVNNSEDLSGITASGCRI